MFPTGIADWSSCTGVCPILSSKKVVLVVWNCSSSGKVCFPSAVLRWLFALLPLSPSFSWRSKYSYCLFFMLCSCFFECFRFRSRFSWFIAVWSNLIPTNCMSEFVRSLIATEMTPPCLPRSWLSYWLFLPGPKPCKTSSSKMPLSYFCLTVRLLPLLVRSFSLPFLCCFAWPTEPLLPYLCMYLSLDLELLLDFDGFFDRRFNRSLDRSEESTDPLLLFSRGLKAAPPAPVPFGFRFLAAAYSCESSPSPCVVSPSLVSRSVSYCGSGWTCSAGGLIGGLSSSEFIMLIGSDTWFLLLNSA